MRLVVARGLADIGEARAIAPLEELVVQAESSDSKNIRKGAETLRNFVKKIKGLKSAASD